MKTALQILGQLILFVVFYVVFLGGSLLAPLGLKWFVTHPTPDSTHYFVPDGLIIMMILYVIVLSIEAAMKRIRTVGLWTSLAFVAALLLGLWSKIGFATHDRF